MPFRAPPAASFNAAFTSSPVVFLSTSAARSTTDTLGVGTRIAKPSSRPLGRRRADVLLRPGGGVLGGVIAVGEQAGRFEDDVDAEILPRQLCRIAHREDLELVAVDGNGVLSGFDFGVQVAEHRVVLE